MPDTSALADKRRGRERQTIESSIAVFFAAHLASVWGYKLWADALGVKPKMFVKALLCYYDPLTYNILFDDDVLNEKKQADAAGLSWGQGP